MIDTHHRRAPMTSGSLHSDDFVNVGLYFSFIFEIFMTMIIE